MDNEEKHEEIVEDELYMTKKGTIKSKNGTFREIKINKFIKKLNKKLLKCDIYVSDERKQVKFNYPLSVNFDKEGYYHIELDGKKYFLSTFSAPRLSTVFDKCVEATSRRITTIPYENITDCDENHLYSIPNRKEYLKALKMLAPVKWKSKLFSFFGIILASLGISVSAFSLTGAISGMIGILPGLGILGLSVASMYIGVQISISSFGYASVWNLLKNCKGLSLDKQIEKMDELVKKYPNEDAEMVTIKEKNYAPGDGHTAGVHQYVHMIIKATEGERMNNHDKREVLAELGRITAEYDEKIHDINVDEMKLLSYTIDKLTSLELKVNKILGQDSRKAIVQATHEETMREIAERIKKTNEDEPKAVAVSGGGRSK